MRLRGGGKGGGGEPGHDSLMRARECLRTGELPRQEDRKPRRIPFEMLPMVSSRAARRRSIGCARSQSRRASPDASPSMYARRPDRPRDRPASGSGPRQKSAYVDELLSLAGAAPHARKQASRQAKRSACREHRRRRASRFTRPTAGRLPVAVGPATAGPTAAHRFQAHRARAHPAQADFARPAASLSTNLDSIPCGTPAALRRSPEPRAPTSRGSRMLAW